MIQKGIGHDKGNGSPRGLAATPKAHPAQFQQLVQSATRHGHAADFFDLGTGCRLVIGKDANGR